MAAQVGRGYKVTCAVQARGTLAKPTMQTRRAHYSVSSVTFVVVLTAVVHLLPSRLSQGVNDDALAHFDPLLRVAAVAWDYLEPPERKIIRASCRSGRLLHDRLLTHLSMAPVGTGDHPATPQHIASAVAAAIARGARLHSCNIVFSDLEAPPAAREEQL